jgi:nitronate monooxygenase
MQAPIGPAGSVELVAAVSASGALGTLAASWTPVADLREQVRWIRSACASPFCVNLVLAFEQRERLAAALDEGAAIVSFSWGVDAGLISVAQDAGAHVLVQVASLGDACRALAAGADALIVQGTEAGGHVQSSRPLLELLRELRPELRVPLLAAGGIADAAGLDEAREAGGDAVVCGTVFLAAEEANVHPTYLEHLIKTDASQTTLTTIFDGGWPDAPHRVIRNDTVAAWEAAGMPARGNRPGEGDQIATRNSQPVLRYDDAQPTRDTHGDIALMAMYAGTSVGAINRREPASHIVERLLKGV